MKMEFLFWIISCLPVEIYAQPDRQISIQTDEGIITVSQWHEGKDMIAFNEISWNCISAGTCFQSEYLPLDDTLDCFILLAAKNSSCSGGIGFSCGLYKIKISVNTGMQQRLFPVKIVKKNSTTFFLLFQKELNWEKLEIFD